MTEPHDGLGLLEDRVARRRRAVPAPRHPGPLGAQPSAPGAPDEAPHEVEPATIQPESQEAASALGHHPRTRAGDHPATRPEESLRNLALRVRASLDDRLNDLVYQLRREGIRTSKVELVEMLLWNLPGRPSADVRSGLEAFRRAAPRDRY